MPLYVARYTPGIGHARNPFHELGPVSGQLEILAIAGDELKATVLFAADFDIAHRLTSDSCRVSPAEPGEYLDEGSESVVIVHDDNTYSVKDLY